MHARQRRATPGPGIHEENRGEAMPTPFGGTTDAAPSSARSPFVLLRSFAWLAVLGAGLGLLHGLGGGTLEVPPRSPGAWSAWWVGTDPVVATMALLRLVVLGLGWYLLVATLLGFIAHVTRSVTLWRLAELVTARSMRELVAGVVGVALVSATSAAASATPALRSNEAAAPVPIQLVLQDDGQRDDGDLDVGDRDGEVAVDVDEGAGIVEGAVRAEMIDHHEPTEQEVLGEVGTDPLGVGDLQRFRRRGGPLADSEPHGPGVGEAAASDPSADPPADEHIVEAGESFWVIAAELLSQAGEPTDDRTVERYWRVLIEANLDRLVVEGEPDLILPGQSLRIPPLGSGEDVGVAP